MTSPQLNEIHLRFGEDRREIIDSLFVEPVQMLISYGVSAFSFDLEGGLAKVETF